MVDDGERVVLELYAPVANGSRWQKFTVFPECVLPHLTQASFTGWAFSECEEAVDAEKEKTISADDVPEEIRRDFEVCNESE
jgi:hypothetical protein